MSSAEHRVHSWFSVWLAEVLKSEYFGALPIWVRGVGGRKKERNDFNLPFGAKVNLFAAVAQW